MLVTTVIFVCVSLTSAADSASQLRFLINEETTLRETLTTRVHALRQRMEALASTIVPCSCTTPPPPPPVFQVAYTGTLPATVSGLTTSSGFNFTSDLINVGAPFTFNDGHFQAPVSGIYGLSLTAYVSSPYWVSMQLKRNNGPVLLVKTGHYTSRQLSMGTNFVLVNMTRGDEVWPAYETGSTYLWAEGISTVSGFLLYQL